MSDSEKEINMIISEPDERDVTNMFASVWVKVEVNEDTMSDPPPVKTRKRIKKETQNKKKSKNLLMCEYCDYTTMYKNCLKFHIVGHENKLLACDHCAYTTKYPTALSRHCKMQHELSPEQKRESSKFRCDHENCSYVTYYRWNLEAHTRKHKLEKQHKCTKCDYQTAYRHNFIKHSKIHNEGMYFKCDKCPFVTKFEGHITRHLAKIHNEVSEGANLCDMCDFSTKVRWRLKTHKQRSRQHDSLKCEHCDFTTHYMCQYKKHRETHFSEIYRSKNLEPKQSLPQKEATPGEEPSEEESPREQYVVDPNCLDWNTIQVLESEDRERPFMCLMCSFTSKFKAAVQRHFQRRHTGSQNRPYKCCHCDFSTKTKDQIALHNKRSRSERPLRCPVCEFTTSHKCQLVTHQKSHYTFRCTLCPYSCRQKYDLQKHYAVQHLGKGLKCSFCEYRAARKETLLCHEAGHTGLKPFRCELCPYSAVRRTVLDAHVRRHHGHATATTTVVSADKVQTLRVPLPELPDLLAQYEDADDEYAFLAQ